MTSQTTSIKYSSLLDWTRDAPPPTEYCRFIRNYDFSATPLGPIEEWPEVLRQNVCHIMVHPHPRVIAWGPELCMLQNEPARQFALEYGRHDCLGKPMKELWPELVDAELGARQQEIMQNGQGFSSRDMLLLLERRGNAPASAEGVEMPPKIECHLDLAMSPILGPDFVPLGILYEYFDFTRPVCANRRWAVVEQIEYSLSTGSEPFDVWPAIMTPLYSLTEDVPFVLAYSIMPKTLGSLPMQERLRYEASIGIEYSHPLVEELKQDRRVLRLLEGAWTEDLPRFKPGEPPQTRDEIHDRKVFFVARNNLPESRLPKAPNVSAAIQEFDHLQTDASVSPESPHGLLSLRQPVVIPGRGHDAPIKNMVVITVPRRTPPDPFGVLVIGMNPMRPCNQEYKSFTNLLKSIIINNITSIVYPRLVRNVTDRLEEMILRFRNLETEARDLTQIEQAFKILLEVAPFGIAFWSRKEEPKYVPEWNNDCWNKLMGIKGDENPTLDVEAERDGLHLNRWRIHIHPEDQDIVQANWQAIIKGTTLGNIEFRVLRQQPGTSVNETIWVLLHSSHHYNRDTGRHSLGAWAMDISMHKRNMANQTQRVDDALEAQRVTEHFIDMVSHELRNPMSAMLQSSDLVVETAKDIVEVARKDERRLPQLSKTILDASEVVTLCTQHQKRIIDDVLMLSKLDARLLIIVPERVQVPSLLDQLQHIYEHELQSAHISCKVCIDDSYREMHFQDVLLDPGRLLQVLMNVFTNAQKFTRHAPIKTINIHLGASFTRPETASDGTKYVPFRNEGVLKNDEQRAAKNVRENNQETVFLTFAIEDSGVGMSSSELRNLFRKFGQASPKTYGQYGGSGLGLFITRDLVELQGGQVGVSSVEGRGTKFFFYIKAERIVEPKRPKLARQSSWTTLLSEYKLQKGNMDRTTTALRERKNTPSPGPSENASPDGTMKLNPLITPPYVFESPTSPGFLKDKHWPVDILLVEDNLINQRILTQQLRKEGYNVATADNGLEAIHYVKQSCFATSPEQERVTSQPCSPNSDESSPAGGIVPPPPFSTPQPRAISAPKLLTIILMDIEMPVMCGLTATRQIRTFEKDGTVTGHIPILAVTANARPDNVQGALDAGMDDVLTKPFRITELLKKMSDVIDAVGTRDSPGGFVPC